MNSIRLLGLGAALAMICATAASAEPVLAKLQSPLPSAAKPVAGGAVFECLGDVCAARMPGSDTATARGCKDLARQVGAVASYGPAARPLNPEQLASCNESARK